IVGEAGAKAVDQSRRHFFDRTTMGNVVVELDLGVWVQKPVDANRAGVQQTAVDALVVQVQRRIAKADLPGAASASRGAVGGAHPKHVLVGDDAIERSQLLVERAVLAGQEVHQLQITALKK